MAEDDVNVRSNYVILSNDLTLNLRFWFNTVSLSAICSVELSAVIRQMRFLFQCNFYNSKAVCVRPTPIYANVYLVSIQKLILWLIQFFCSVMYIEIIDESNK